MWALIRFETRKFVGQKKNWLGFLTIIMINLLFAVAFYLRSQHGGEPHELAKDRLIGEFMNAFVYTQVILAPCVYLLFPMDLAIVGGHLLAGELEAGSLRMMLVRPVGRWQVVIAKFCVLSVYAAVLILCLGLVSYAISCVFLRPSGDLIVAGPIFMLKHPFLIHPAADVPARILLTYVLAVPMLMSVSAMALMFAMVTRHFTSAAITTSTVYFCSYVVQSIPFLSAVHPFLPTRYLPFWRRALEMTIPWAQIGTDACWTVAYTAVFLGLATALFSIRDV